MSDGRIFALLDASELPALTAEEFRFFGEVIFRLAGIKMTQQKFALVQVRLRERIGELRLKDFQEYREYLEGLDSQDPEWQIFTNRLTTNKTDFFREPKHFEFLLQDFLPKWLAGSAKTLRLWCCASSTGEEPYTLAMILDRALPEGRDFEILATDIDTAVLKTAANAVYPVSKWSEIPADYQRSSLELGHDRAQDWFRIRRHLKNHVSFQRHNLIEKPGDDKKDFDLIFCRNVLIYFSRETIIQVSAYLRDCTRPNGYLVIGHAESLRDAGSKGWRQHRPAVYRKTG